mmetsp:Transcript_44729/g.95137  ORF Transcript_44729/g.95137 Transcript_44729/m.95137 type:complete len:104 (-) Transcript_44729:979-1290(-)|eukprot:CAMPEP_0183332602 /NCGR_PEP_ID=MMETSP0164_2-20130417/1724_1 /TAXON_ID=221442 /ORGANISM="Coccolithus pelagicus ssp braarudi, Strain PLY182g" /LENGTH=103 /DNA_ID=CAMNT_0025501355 /DNA_START=24 /DNA_END=335 /DNA_ORIENTATION=+
MGDEEVTYIADDEDDEDVGELASSLPEPTQAAQMAFIDPVKVSLQVHICMVLMCTLCLLCALIMLAWRRFGNRITRARSSGGLRLGDTTPETAALRSALKKRL